MDEDLWETVAIYKTDVTHYAQIGNICYIVADFLSFYVNHSVLPICKIKGKSPGSI